MLPETFSMEFFKGMMIKELSLKSSLPYLAAAVGSWYFYKVFIRPYLSPLRKIPGRPYKPFIGNMFEALKEEAMNNAIRWMRESKSKIVRFYFFFGEERVLVGDPALVKHILVTNSKNYIRLGSFVNSILPSFILVLSGENHHTLRKVINPAFNSKAVNDFIPTFEDISRQVIHVWKEQLHNSGESNITVPAQGYMSRLTLDVICRCGFGYEMGAVDNTESSIVKSIQNILKTFALSFSGLLPTQWIPTKRNRQLWSDFKVFNSTIAQVIKKKRNQDDKEQNNDMLARLILARDEQGRPLSDDCLKNQVGGFLFAGYETTSIGLTWTLLQLAKHPEIQEKTRQEVTSLITDKSESITMDILDNLPYLTCVIKETLRLLPPLTTIFRKAVKQDTLGGYTIPAGTPVGISVGALHRLESNWSDPETFKPERFLEDYDHYKFIPFSAGPYMCIGYIFALLEIKVTLALILQNFRFTLPEGYKYRRIRQITMQPYPPLDLVIESL